jgi:hypothetical protein
VNKIAFEKNTLEIIQKATVPPIYLELPKTLRDSPKDRLMTAADLFNKNKAKKIKRNVHSVLFGIPMGKVQIKVLKSPTGLLIS